MMEIKKFIPASFFVLALTSGCGGSSGGSTPTPPPVVDNCPVAAGQMATATYTVSWDAILDADLSGYKIYYGSNANLTRSNALGSVDVDMPQTSATFSPADYNILTCTQVTIAASSVGLRPESALSDIQTFQVE